MTATTIMLTTKEKKTTTRFESDNNNYNAVYVNIVERVRAQMAPLLYNGNCLTLAPIHVPRT